MPWPIQPKDLFSMPVFALLLGLTSTAQEPDPAPFWNVVQPEAVCSMSGTWAIGLNTAQPNLTNVNVEFLDENGRRIVQALHRGVFPGDVGHDVYLLDARTLHPTMTENTGPVPPVRFRFDAGDLAVKLTADNIEEERISLSGMAIPEGPGLEIITQAVPWADGLALEGVMLDRWRGTGQERNRKVIWRVEGRERRETLSGIRDLFRTRLTPHDGGFEIVAYITLEQPHFIARMEYRHRKDGPVLVSEMREAAFNCNGLASPA